MSSVKLRQTAGRAGIGPAHKLLLLFLLLSEARPIIYRSHVPQYLTTARRARGRSYIPFTQQAEETTTSDDEKRRGATYSEVWWVHSKTSGGATLHSRRDTIQKQKDRTTT